MGELLEIFAFFLVVFTGGMLILLFGTLAFSRIPYWIDQMKDDI